MKTLTKIVFCLPLLVASTASADTVVGGIRKGLRLERAKADLYVSPDGSTAVATAKCTQSTGKGGMTAKVGEHRGRLFVTFYDSEGREEGDCQVTAVVRRVASR